MCVFCMCVLSKVGIPKVSTNLIVIHELSCFHESWIACAVNYRNSLHSHCIYSLKALTQDMDRLKNVSFIDLSQCQCESLNVWLCHSNTVCYVIKLQDHSAHDWKRNKNKIAVFGPDHLGFHQCYAAFFFFCFF